MTPRSTISSARTSCISTCCSGQPYCRAPAFARPPAYLPTAFLTVNGLKMSKSRGTFIQARTYLDNLDPSYLRYYYAAKLNPTIEDLDLNLDDFVARVNSDLVGKLVNIASRCAGFINKRFDGTARTRSPTRRCSTGLPGPPTRSPAFRKSRVLEGDAHDHGLADSESLHRRAQALGHDQGRCQARTMFRPSARRA